jgi:ureidoacrylate peracid hydrolase
MLCIPAEPEPVEIDPARTAVIVVDMQNAFASEGGMLELAGMDITGAEEVVAVHERLLAAARAKGIDVVYLQIGYDADQVDAGGPDSPSPLPGDYVVHKTRYSGFAGTNLDQMLRSRDKRYLLFTGIATNVCVESTLRDAFFHEYWPVLVSDATMQAGPPAMQEATEFNVRTFLGWVTTSDAVIGALTAAD